MTRTRSIAVLAGLALAVVAVLVAFAWGISANQSSARRRLITSAHQRAVLVAGLLDAVFEQNAHAGAGEVAMLGTPIVLDSEVQALRGQDAYVVLLDTQGDVIAHSAGFTAQARHAVLGGRALRLIDHGAAWSLGDRDRYQGTAVVQLGERLDTTSGERVLITGVPASTLSTLVDSELSRVPGAARQHQIMVDGHGVVIGSTVPDRPFGYVFHTSSQLHALSHPAGIVHSPTNGTRYFDSVSLENSGWKLLLTVPVGEFFAPIAGLHHSLPWILLVAFGIVALLALALVARSMQASERIRVANHRLTDSNAELGAAHERLAESHRALERQARELVRSNSELDQFASIASHDLQEPLRKVRTFTERVAETDADNLSERGTDYLRRANASAERMQVLIEDLLRFSRVTTQVRPYGPVDLAAVTADVLDDLSEQIARVGARVEVGPLPTISADVVQVRQLMQNLVSNALKFRREDVGPVVRIAGESQAGWMTLTVADNGIGFDPQYAQRIFRVFERLHGRGTYPGTGIGLALCRKIAERHGGTVVADSAPGEGATFTVTMQTERTEAVSAAPDQPAQDGSPTREEPYVAA